MVLFQPSAVGLFVLDVGFPESEPGVCGGSFSGTRRYDPGLFAKGLSQRSQPHDSPFPSEAACEGPSEARFAAVALDISRHPLPGPVFFPVLAQKGMRDVRHGGNARGDPSGLTSGASRPHFGPFIVALPAVVTGTRARVFRVRYPMQYLSYPFLKLQEYINNAKNFQGLSPYCRGRYFPRCRPGSGFS